MTSFRSLVAASALTLVAGIAAATASQAAPASKAGATQAEDLQAWELSAAKRVYHRRYVRHYNAPHYQGPRYSAYLRGRDPGLGPDGLPYGPPAHLRGQCYIDEGYGRFSACSNR